MKIVAIIPIKKDSQRVRKKNYRKINGTPLYKITLDKLKKCKFDNVYVDSDSEIIKKYCEKNKINFIRRKPALARNSANGNHLLLHHAKLIKADVYFQVFITSPLLKISTILILLLLVLKFHLNFPQLNKSKQILPFSGQVCNVK